MTKRRSTKRALLLSALSLLLCVSMLIGSTFAWFTDSVTSKNNIIKAGNLDVELEYKKVVDGAATDWASVKDQDNIFDKNALWEPGHVEVVYLKVTNLGSLALKYQLSVNVYNEIIGKTEDGKDIKLSDHLVFKTVDMADGLTTYTDREAVKLAAGTEKGLKDYNGKTTSLEAKNEAGTNNFEDYVALIVYMPETVGNEANYRGTDVPTIELGINLYATQFTAESDSFDKFYDENAWVEGMKVSTADELEAALTTGGKVSLYDNIELDDSVAITEDTAINLRGYAMSSKTGEVLEVTDGAKVEIGNGTINANAANANAITVSNTKAGTTSTLDLTDVKINLADVGDANSNNIVASAEEGKAVLNINEGTVVNSVGEWTAAIKAVKNAEVNVNGGEINVENTSGDGVFAISVEDSSAVVNVTGGVFNITGNHSASGIVTWGDAPTVNISGGVFNVETTGGYGIAVEVYAGQVNATGGTFNIMATGGAGAYAFAEGSNLDLNVGSGVTINVLQRNGNTAYESGNANPNTDCTANIYAVIPAATTDELKTALQNAKDGDTIQLTAGEYTMPSTSTDITIVGTKDTKVELPYKAVSGNANVITFEGVTILGETDGGWYSELFNGATKVVYKNCEIYNQLTTYTDTEFIDCNFYNTFDNDYSVYCYSGNEIKFDGCSFNTKCSKAIKVYDEGNGGRKVYVNDCSFTTETANKKAAVEIDSSYSNYYIYFTGENTLSGAYTKLWNSDAGEDKGTFVYVDGVLTVNSASQLQAMLKAVPANTTIALAANTVFEEVKLNVGIAENLTIVGAKGAVVKGIHGVKGTSQLKVIGLTLKDIAFQDKGLYFDATGTPWTLVKNLTMTGCTFVGTGASDDVIGNRLFDIGSDSPGSNQYFDIVIENCTVSNAIQGIRLGGLEGANTVIRGNTIENIGHNGITLRSINSSGKVLVEGNKISNSGDRAFRIGVNSGSVTYKTNTIINCGDPDDGTNFKANTLGTVVFEGNTVDGAAWNP